MRGSSKRSARAHGPRGWLATLVVSIVVLLGAAATSLAAGGTHASGRLPTLTVKGNQILADGKPFHFYGVNRDSLEWGADNWGGCGGDGHFTLTDFKRIRSWHINAVRIPLSEGAWLGRDCNPQIYIDDVQAAVADANRLGMYVILDLHWTDVGGRAPCNAGCRSGQQPMPDVTSIPFWEQVAARFRNDPGVIFDLFNEPYGASWSCWLDGGCIDHSNPATNHGIPVAYEAVGMQTLYDAVRETGARNLVIVGGLDFAYNLSGIGRGYALKGTNIAYDTHVYVAYHDTYADWNASFGYLTRTAPVVSLEFGSTNCSTAGDAKLLNYFDDVLGHRADRISWTIWSWNAPGSCSQPSVLANWNGTPLKGQGVLVKHRLAALAKLDAA